jgi:hypothetical protein
MASRFSQQKKGSELNLQLVSSLLQDGATFIQPSADLHSASAHLQSAGLIGVEHHEYVRCANPKDADYPPRNRNCSGRIYLDVEKSTRDGGLKCPECDRAVYPAQYEKERFNEIRTCVSREGVFTFLDHILTASCEGIKHPAVGVFSVGVREQSVTVCVADFAQEQFLSRERAMTSPTCFVIVDSSTIDDRVLNEPWVRHATLTDIVCGKVELMDLVRSATQDHPPKNAVHACMPIYRAHPDSIIYPQCPERELTFPPISDPAFE